MARAALFLVSVTGFAPLRLPGGVVPRDVARAGIFDGVKSAFDQDQPILEEDRVTPFDRWLGIDVERTEAAEAAAFAVPDDFVDSMDEANYVSVELSKPMGIVFEENDPSSGGVFVASLAEGGAAAEDSTLKSGDQLIAVGATNVKGRDFDTCLGAIQASTAEKTKIVVFRGGPSSLYGNLGASDDWMGQYIAKIA